jgi:hypothetical protein
MYSKAKAIQAVLNEAGVDTPFHEIQRRLKTQNIDVTPQQVSNEKRRLRNAPNIKDLPASVLKEVKAFVKKMGSAAVVRRALDELEALDRIDRDTNPTDRTS